MSFAFSLLAFVGVLPFIPVYYRFRFTSCRPADSSQQNVANLNLRSSDPIGRAESQTFPFPLFHLMFSFESFASRPDFVLSPAHFCFRLAGCPLCGFVPTECWKLTLVLFFEYSCFRLLLCILVSFGVFCLLASRACSWSFAHIVYAPLAVFCSGFEF